MPEKITEENIAHVLDPHYSDCIASTLNGSEIYDFNERIRSYTSACYVMKEKDSSLCEGIQVESSYNMEHEILCKVLTSVAACVDTRDALSSECAKLPEERRNLLDLLFSGIMNPSECEVISEESYRGLCKAVVTDDPKFLCSEENSEECEEYMGYLLVRALMNKDTKYCDMTPDYFESQFCRVLVTGDWDTCRDDILSHTCALESIVLHKRYGTDKVDCSYFEDESSRVYCEQLITLFM